ncbi:hypothetical protein OAU50_08965 [Planctomycetota bacterium]|nr:hypothetical protein [Planctomycetota bacterium]
MNDASELRMQPISTPIDGFVLGEPEMRIGGGEEAIYFIHDTGYGRLTFEKLDSIRHSRGEQYPYRPTKRKVETWLYSVIDSPWQRERYEYEAGHYGHMYEFNGDVTEMLTEFSHYVVVFEDEFVEAIARGIWMESGNKKILYGEYDGHPLLDLPKDSPTETIEAHGLKCQYRMNPKSDEEISRDAVFCTQPLIDVVLDFGDGAKPSWYLGAKYIDGSLKSILRRVIAKGKYVFDGIAGIEEIRPMVEEWLAEVRQRRDEMGKD